MTGGLVVETYSVRFVSSANLFSTFTFGDGAEVR
jgi:hypothetical protein